MIKKLLQAPRKAIAWIKKFVHVVNDYDRQVVEITDALTSQRIEVGNLRATVKHGVSFIKDATSIHADVHIDERSPNQIIVCGRYRGGRLRSCVLGAE
jgi:hypothetical protein